MIQEKECAKREQIEWGNYWIESANSIKTKRILLIGDSVARSFRPILNDNLNEVAVDYLGTSASVMDELFEQFFMFFCLYQNTLMICV